MAHAEVVGACVFKCMIVAGNLNVNQYIPHQYQKQRYTCGWDTVHNNYLYNFPCSNHTYSATTYVGTVGNPRSSQYVVAPSIMGLIGYDQVKAIASTMQQHQAHMYHIQANTVM